MDPSLLAVLTESERLLVAETERAALGTLDEDGAIALETRIRRARDKYASQCPPVARARGWQSKAAGARHGRRTPGPGQRQRRSNGPLAQVSQRVAALARQSAAALRTERLAAAKAAKQGDWPGAGGTVPRQRRQGPEVTPEPTGERARRNPASEKERASTLAQGARRQAKRDSKRGAAR